MIRLITRNRFLAALLLAAITLTPATAEIVSVEPVAADTTQGAPAPLSSRQLEELVGPVALYPDDLLAIVLPASTYPLDIVKAARFLEARAQDNSLQPDEQWDESVIALLNYPEVVTLLDADLDWTWTLGEAVLFQEDEVIAAIERFRDDAYQAGNLRSDEHQVVEIEDGAVTIEPVRKEVIYVPYYEPRQVVVYQRAPVYHYYPRAYPVYYYPYPANYYFSSGFFWGVSTAFHISFSNHHLRLHHYTYASHPYYGRPYYPVYYRHHRYHRHASSFHRAYRAHYRNNYRAPTSRSYEGARWHGSYRSGVRPREYNDYNYPPASTRKTVNRSRTNTHRVQYTSPGRATSTRANHARPATQNYRSGFSASSTAADQRRSANSAQPTTRTGYQTQRPDTASTSASQRSGPARTQAARQVQQRDDARSANSRYTSRQTQPRATAPARSQHATAARQRSAQVQPAAQPSRQQRFETRRDAPRRVQSQSSSSRQADTQRAQAASRTRTQAQSQRKAPETRKAEYKRSPERSKSSSNSGARRESRSRR